LNTETNSFDLLKALKRAEPLGLLASLSLVISAFSFEGLGNLYKIYSYSVVSAFMFIFSFLFSIVTDCFNSTKNSQHYPILRILQAIINYGPYFSNRCYLIFDFDSVSVWTSPAANFYHN